MTVQPIGVQRPAFAQPRALASYRHLVSLEKQRHREGSEPFYRVRLTNGVAVGYTPFYEQRGAVWVLSACCQATFARASREQREVQYCRSCQTVAEHTYGCDGDYLDSHSLLEELFLELTGPLEAALAAAEVSTELEELARELAQTWRGDAP